MGFSTEAYVGPVHPAVDKYEVRRFPPYGIAVFGLVPVDELVRMIEGWGKEGYKLVDVTICQHLRATLAIVKDEATGRAWREELGLRIDHPDWLLTGDTGISSRTIYAVMTSNWGVVHRGKDGFDVPCDGDDFGRCYRLVKRFPEYRQRLPEIVTHCPEWKPIVERWDEIAQTFEAEGKLDEHGRQTAATPKTDALLSTCRP